MHFETSDGYHPHFPFTYGPPNSSYYLNSPQSYQLSRSFENSFGISNEQIQFKQKSNRRLHNKSHRHNSNVATRQLNKSINSTKTIPTSIQKLPLTFPHSNTIHKNSQSELFSSIIDCCRVLRDQSETISTEDMKHLLNKLTFILKRFQNNNKQQQQLHITIDILSALICVRPSILVAASQNEFFSVLQRSFIHILRHWRRRSFLPDDESFMFRTMTKLIRRLLKATDDMKLIPPWLSDSILLEAISDCITDVATSGKFLNKNNTSPLNFLTYLIDAYVYYQQRLNDEDHSDKDRLVQLLDPILNCLTSSHFMHTFTNMPKDAKSMTTIEKFFLVKCPAFLTSYNGFRLEQTMESLLSTMLSQYTQLLDKVVSSAQDWKQSMIGSVHYLFHIFNHGADQFQTNAKLVSGHLPLIDDVLKLVNEPVFYNNLRETLSNPETIFMNTAISFLVNMISEPIILTHIKQCQVTDAFLRLTSCKYEPLVLNVYKLLAYTTREQDIGAMYNPGRLLAIILKSLRTTLDRTPNDKNHIEQLSETLKGLVQHDQIKDEIIKQNALPFLLECTNKLTDRALILLLEILWSLTFREEGALALRSNKSFLDKIQTISKDSNDEPLKKAADGLVWKLIREPKSLEKVAKQEEKEEAETEEIITTPEVVIGEEGGKQVVITKRRGSMTPSERSYRYDIMISYCHADKELTYKIHKFLLDHGFKVWIDLDNMYGPAMSAMADAVENSEFVIMCMSDSYKQSTYCQAEAEYAFKCKRRLVPLIMREGYKPDGWLGFMIGSRMYIDFVRYDFKTACEKLLTEISHQRKLPLPSKSAQINQHELPTKTVSNNQQTHTSQRKKSLVTYDNHGFSVYTRRKPMSDFSRKALNQWTESDVLDFLFTQRLIQLMPLCEAMDGRALIQLYKMGISRSSKTYALLDNELKSTYKMKLPLGIFTRFLSAIEQKLTAHPSIPNETISKLPVTTVTTFLEEYISYPSKTSVISDLSFPYPSYPDQAYDVLITSDAPAEDVLQAVLHYGPNFVNMSSVLTQNSVRF